MPHKVHPLLALSALMAVVACHDVTSDTLTAPRRPLVGAQPVVRQDEMTGEAVFRRIARDLPEFGGYWFDDEGNLVVFVADTARASQVRSRLEPLLREYQSQVPNHWKGRRNHGRVAVRNGEFTFLELASWRDEVVSALATTQGVVFVDLDETANKVMVGIETPAAEATVEGVLRGLPVLAAPCASNALRRSRAPSAPGRDAWRRAS